MEVAQAIPSMQSIEYKPDFQDAIRRLEAFWQGTIIDRPPILITTAQSALDFPDVPAPAGDLDQLWLNSARVARAAENQIARTYWGGEAIPFAFANLGPFLLSALMGADMIMDSRTIWAEARPMTLQGILDLEPDFDNVWWHRLGELVDALLETGRGKFIVSLTDIHGPSDHLAALRGSTELCMDLIDRPTLAHLALERMLDHYLEFHGRHWQQFSRHQSGTLSWQGWWTPGRGDILQEDFSDLLSPAQFREFILPLDQRICHEMDHTLFHIHGTMIRHTEPICELQGLRAMQWPSENLRGQGYMPIGRDLTEWLPYIRRIQSKGKAVYLVLGIDEVEKAIEALDPRQLLLHVKDCRNPSEADFLLERAVEWTSDRLQKLETEEVHSP